MQPGLGKCLILVAFPGNVRSSCPQAPRDPTDSYGANSNTYCGSADAILQAGLIPDLRYFPGQPGVNKMQVKYQTNWRPVSTASTGRSERWLATIRKRGNSGQFTVEVPVPKEEFERRKALSEAREEERKANCVRFSAERKLLRQGASSPQKSAEEFRAERLDLAEWSIKLLWSTVFAKSEGGLSLNIEEGSELWDDLAGAFQAIRDVVQEASILRDKKLDATAKARLKLVAARQDKGLQSVLQSAKHLRLVRPNDDEE